MEHVYSESQKEIVEKFLSLLTSFTRECGLCIVDEGGFIFRMVEGKPLLTVSRTFLQNLGDYPVVLTLDKPVTSDVVVALDNPVPQTTVQPTVVEVERRGMEYRITTSSFSDLVNMPLHIQQMIARVSLSETEFKTLLQFLSSRGMIVRVSDIVGTVPLKSVTPEPSETESEVPEDEDNQVHLSSSDDESAEDSSVVSEPEEKPVKSRPVEPVKAPETQPVKTKVVFFRKKQGDKTVCKLDDYVYKVKLVGAKNELTCVGRYDAATNGWTPLSKKDIKIVKSLGYKIAE